MWIVLNNGCVHGAELHGRVIRLRNLSLSVCDENFVLLRATAGNSSCLLTSLLYMTIYRVYHRGWCVFSSCDVLENEGTRSPSRLAY